jgi:two-component system cell cycle response regulator DivK
MRGDEEKMRAAGCDGYISKPIDVNRFAGQIRQLLEPPGGHRASEDPVIHLR